MFFSESQLRSVAKHPMLGFCCFDTQPMHGRKKKGGKEKKGVHAGLTRLTRLVVQGCQTKAYYLTRLTSLQELSLAPVYVDTYFLRNLAKLTGLRVLELGNGQPAPAVSLAPLECLPLQRLQLPPFQHDRPLPPGLVVPCLRQQRVRL